MNYRSLLLLGLLSCMPSFIKSHIIIWDIGEVLYTTNRLGVARSIGISHFISRLLFDWKNPNIKHLLFDVLEQLECPPLPEDIRLQDKDGTPLSPAQCHFQAGTMSRKEILDGARDLIDRLEKEGYFYSERERILIEKTILGMFNPFILADNAHPIRAGLRTLAQCAHEVDENGNRRNHLIALSNWDGESFDIFYELNRDYMSLFDDIAVSGKTGLIKPRKAAYTDLIERFNLNPEECLVIDDLETNLTTARNLGFNTFRVQNGNYQELREALVEFGALDQVEPLFLPRIS